MLREEQVEKNYETFINLIKENIKREGVEQLLKWLSRSDVKIAPASIKYHSSYKGGLIQHTLNVYDRLNKLLELEYKDSECPYSKETISIVALLHDISKINHYEILEKNTKDEKGNWIKVPYYQVKEETNRLIFGSHCMNSLYMVSKFLKLNYEEELAILYHMGCSDGTEDKITIKNTADVFNKSTLAMLLHSADMHATFIDESIYNE